MSIKDFLKAVNESRPPRMAEAFNITTPTPATGAGNETAQIIGNMAKKAAGRKFKQWKDELGKEKGTEVKGEPEKPKPPVPPVVVPDPPKEEDNGGFKLPQIDMSGFDLTSTLDALNKPWLYKVASGLAQRAGDQMDAEGGSGGGLRDWAVAHADTSEKVQEQQNKEAELAEKKRQADMDFQIKLIASGKTAAGSKIPATTALTIADQKGAIEMLGNLSSKIDELPDDFGPLYYGGKFNPWDTKAQTFNQYGAMVKQVIGKGLEGGVLRKEDEEKYKEILPKWGDTKDVLKAKSQQLAVLLKNKYSNSIDTLAQTGYDTSSISQPDSAIAEEKGVKENPTITALRKAGASEAEIQAVKKEKGW